MTDLYQSNRTQAEKYFQKVQASLDSLIEIEALPPFDADKPQPFYLEFKKKITPWIEQETERQHKELERSDNSHLLLLKRTALVDTVVIASGAFSIPNIPALSNAVPSTITTVTPNRYRNPSEIHEGGVLVVGADELRRIAREGARAGVARRRLLESTHAVDDD